MVTDRMRRQLERFLDDAEAAANSSEWTFVADKARAVLALEPDNADALGFLKMAEANLGAPPAAPEAASPAPPQTPSVEQSSSFVAGRYAVRRFLGEGGKKRVYLAHDERLDRDVAFALIKADGLDDVGRERIVREAQAIGRIGAHPHIVGIYEIGEEGGAPYIVTELLGGGDVAAVLASEGGALPLARTLEIAKGVARGLAFAHQQGIVHRDLKPGNVWLTASGPEGVAKIGDFGLAVALDRSRLTTHGLMVGTVAYMPPEQALGGEVTPQADLYSLGAMLYELVTGKPPFAGDSPTAIISQHINTPPVAPSWHSEHCPPDLEALILKLLAKVPADRPSSATEVLEALERVDPEARSASHSDSSANPLDRLARGVFVGRERELERLRGAFDDAFAARGSVVMLVGEPGIGKTRTTRELATHARMRGGVVLWGGAQESSGAPPYWPWVLAARTYRDQTPEEERRKQWQPYAVDLQRIFTGLRDLFPGLQEPPPIDSEEGQFRLFDAFSSFLRAIATEKPLLVVLDDLHWADRATLQMLTHVARELAHARILVAGTYRDTDLDRQHPLSRTLAELNREQLFTRISLRGLARDEIGEYIRAAAQVEPGARLVERVHEETEGNPFFLSEVVNLMAQEGSFEHASVSDVAIPEGVKEALGRRLDRLSAEANELLALAAVLGREFDHAQLVAVSTQADDEVLRLVEEALGARVLEETRAVGGYRFTHALMQETLLGELSSARRVRLHGQIAEALDALYGDNAEAHAPELARHYLESSALNRAHAGAAARYSRLAAEQAARAMAYDDAVEHYERCLDEVSRSPDGLGEDEAALWTELARCQLFLPNVRSRGWESLNRAAAVYRQRGALRELGKTLIRVLEGALPQAEIVPQRPLLVEAVAALAGERSIEACRLLALAALSDFGPAGDEEARRAEAMAVDLDVPEDERPVELLVRHMLDLRTRGDFIGAVDYADALHARLGSQTPWIVLRVSVITLILIGDQPRLANALDRSLAFARRQGRRYEEYAMLSFRARIHWQAGERDSAAATKERIPSGAYLLGELDELRGALEGGDIERAQSLLPSEDHPGLSTIGQRASRDGLQTLICLARGDEQGARTSFGRWTESYRSLRDTQPMNVLELLDRSGEPMVKLGDDALLEEVAATLAACPDLRGGIGCGFDWLRGSIALRLDRVEDAGRHFRTGVEWASSGDVHFNLIVGRCLQGLAEVAERRGDIEGARAHLDAAGALFAKHGAKLYLDQVIAKKEILRA